MEKVNILLTMIVIIITIIVGSQITLSAIAAKLDDTKRITIFMIVLLVIIELFIIKYLIN